MNFFNDLGKKLGKTAKTVTKKSEDLVEITKLNLAIGNEEDKIKKLLLEIGGELYAKYTEGHNFDEQLTEKCTQVEAIHNSIASLKDKINGLKVKDQPSCCDCCTEEENKEETPCCSECNHDEKEGEETPCCSGCENKAEAE